MAERRLLKWGIVAALAASVCAPGVVQARGVGVFYHDQSSPPRSGIAAQQAVRLASARLGFAVRLPTTWPRDSALRALWVMDRHVPRFVVIYYGGGDGYITCQLHESRSPTAVALNWAPRTTTNIGRTRGAMLRSYIGGPNPVIELLWRVHGIYFDLLGSTQTPLSTLLTMARSLT